MKKIPPNPLMLYRSDTSEFVFWPNGRMRFWGNIADAVNMRRLLVADYGTAAILWVCRAKLCRDKTVLKYEWLGRLAALCRATGSEEDF